MGQIVLRRSALMASLTAFIAFGVAAFAQFGGHRERVNIDVASYPADIQRDYKVFANKCSECHDLTSSLKQSRSQEGWTAEVRRMQAMASSHINSREADQITKFLAYDEIHRKAAARETAGATSGSSPDAVGKQLFESYGCSSCHSVAGVGNTASALDGVVSKRTAEELKKLIVSPPAGSTMPAMAVPQKDLDGLVAYLLTVKSR